MAFPTKNSVFGRFSSLPSRPPPPSKARILFLLSSRRLWEWLGGMELHSFAFCIFKFRSLKPLEAAQQRYFSYRAILVAIVSQTFFVLVFMWYRTIIALCETKYQGGCIAPFGGAANFPEKVSRDMGYRSDSIAISHDMGPLSWKLAKIVLPSDFDNSGISCKVRPLNEIFRTLNPHPAPLKGASGGRGLWKCLMARTGERGGWVHASYSWKTSTMLPQMIAFLILGGRRAPNSTETQKELKWPKSDSKLSPWAPLQSDPKWLKSDSEMGSGVTFGSLWGRSARVTFESLSGHFSSFWVSVALGARWLHNFNSWRIKLGGFQRGVFARGGKSQ